MRIPTWLEPILERLKPVHHALRFFAVEIVLRRILIPIVLFFSYFFAVGATAIFTRIFAHRRLSSPQGWVKAEGYEADLCKEQS